MLRFIDKRSVSVFNIWKCWECLFQVASHQKSTINSTTKTAKYTSCYESCSQRPRRCCRFVNWLIISTASKSEFAQVLTFPKSAFSRAWEIQDPPNTMMVPWALFLHTQIATRSIQSFFAGLTLVTLQQTDTYMDHATCVAVDRIHAMQCDVT